MNPRPGNRLQDVAQDILATDNDRGNNDNRFQDREPHGVTVVRPRPRCKQRQERQDWNDREILEQQNGERRAAMRTRQLAFLGQNLQRKCGRRQRQRKPDYNSTFRRQTNGDADGDQDNRRHQNLCATQAEHCLAHGPQTRRLQLQADDEKEQHDAELGEMENILHIGDDPQRRWADDDTRGEITQDRPESQSLRQRHRDNRRAQKDGGHD